MIELLIAACLAGGPCRDVSLLFDAREVTLIACVIGGQVEAARWQAHNPGWAVRGWRCRMAGEDGSAA